MHLGMETHQPILAGWNGQ